MRNIHKKLALLLALLTCTVSLASAMVGCTGGKEEDTTEAVTNTSPETEPGGNSGSSDTKINYAVTVKSVGGLALSGVNVYIYADSTKEDLVSYGATDATGKAVISMPRKDGYVAVLSGLPQGYTVEDSYPLSGVDTTLTVTSQVIDSTDHTGLSYKLGDVMRDFQVVDSDGNTLKLSELLKTKKMVLINFWYTTCSWCVKEFPYMNSAYEKYKDDIEIVALNHYNSDTEDAVKAFKAEYGLSFPMAKDYTGMGPAFVTQGYPTSVVVDRYGVVCLIESGGIVSETPFLNMFEHFTAENYEQKLFSNLDELNPAEKPNVSMPSSEEIAAVFNSGNLTVTYRPETEDENAELYWPFIIGEKDGVACIRPANAYKQSSFAILYADVTLKAGQALAFDYWSSNESGGDILYMLVNAKDIYQISGESTQWNTCYTFVATEDGEYEVAFCYAKDESTDVGDDTVYLKNLRVVDVSAIDQPTYIPRYAATHRAADGYGYEKYVSVVYSEADGYYHVGTADGPILLVNLMQATPFSDTPIYTHAYNGQIVVDGVDYYEAIVTYCSYASNSNIYGLCSVNKELKNLLEKVAAAIGLENDNPNEWLQMCSYYDAYGTDGVQLEDPIKGLSTHSAYEAVEGDGNYIYYNRIIMPRGLLYKFTPEKSGAYRITSDSEWEVEGWIFLDDRIPYYTHQAGERLWNDPVNLSMVVYLEAGTDYYIDIAFYDPYQVGDLTFSVDYLGASYDLFTIASPGYFTFPDGTDTGSGLGELAEILSGGIDIALGDDGFYHEKRADGSLGSVLYADFIGLSGIFSHSLREMIDLGAFNFSLTESDQEILNYVAQYGDGTRAKLQEIWGEQFEDLAEIKKLDEVLEGKTHGNGKDRTEEARAYLDQLIGASEDAPELEGCVAVNTELADLLQALMDKYTFAGVDYSWGKLCFYYQHLGA